MHFRHYGMGRSRDSGFEDSPENACAGCRVCHTKHHAGQIPTRVQLQERMRKWYGYVYERE